MMDLIFFFDSPEDGDGVLDTGLLDQDRLEAAFQGGIFFDILAVFVQGGGADAVQFTTGQGRFEHVGGVHGTFGGTGTHQGVNLVDKQDDLPGPFFHFLEDGLEPVFKFAPILGTSDQGAQVQGHDLSVGQGGRDVTVHDPDGQPLGNGGLADAGFADQDRIILGPS